VKGIILAGGSGSRLYPSSRVASKQLQPVYDKPMIYYPLATLMLGGIKEVLIISTPDDTPRFRHLLGDGSQWGMKLSYAVQEKPAGLAQALIIGEKFIAGDPVLLILGDNVFYGRMKLDEIISGFKSGAMVFGYPVSDPKRYGVIEFDPDGKVLSIEEKPENPKSNYAVPGLYLYDSRGAAMANQVKPSGRGELEITTLNNMYLEKGELNVSILGRGIVWFDTGTPASLLEASNFIYTVEARQGLKIACLEEIAFLRGFLDLEGLKKTLAEIPKSPYREYLEKRFPEAV